jgi:hypothetical protein
MSVEATALVTRVPQFPFRRHWKALASEWVLLMLSTFQSRNRRGRNSEDHPFGGDVETVLKGTNDLVVVMMSKH